MGQELRNTGTPPRDDVTIAWQIYGHALGDLAGTATGRTGDRDKAVTDRMVERTQVSTSDATENGRAATNHNCYREIISSQFCC